MTIIRPSLLLDFANSRQLGARASHVRASTGGYWDALGARKAAPLGAPRFTHDPLTGRSLGLLVEDAVTNLFLYSSQFDNAAWQKSELTVSADVGAAADGTMTADKLIPSTNSAAHQTFQTGISFTSGVTYVRSVDAAAAGYRYLHLGFSTPHFSSNPYAIFDLQTGTVVATNGAVTAWVSWANGLWRCSIAATATATGSGGDGGMRVLSAANLNAYAGDGTSGVLVGAAELNAAAFPTSHTPTTTGSVTRAADTPSLPSAGWFNGAEGTLLARARTPRGIGAASQVLLNIASASGERITVSRDTSRNIRVGVVTGSVVQADMVLSSVADETDFAVAVRYKSNDIAASLNGGSVVTDTSATLPAITTAYLGHQNGVNFWSGTIAKLAAYPRGLTNSELQQLAA